MKPITFTNLIVSVFLGYTTEAQNLIINGSFESPVIQTSSRQIGTPTSWTVGVDAVLINGNGGVAELPLPLEGQQYVSVATSPAYTLSQQFTVTSQMDYVLRWFDSTAHESGGSVSAPYSVAVLNSANQTVASASLEAYHPEDWRERTLNMTLSPGTYTLRFTPVGNGPGGLSPLFDNVSLKPSSIVQPCPGEGPVSGGTWKNHGQYVSCVAKAAEADLNAGLITEDQKDAIVEQAAQSSCGKR